ncbi:MAG TPA: glycosyltransferase family 4 protein [Noviherbaspirillum sp.]|nr:glycosyltransferase family 4 protein [Noviherbaspirillum sp.]
MTPFPFISRLPWHSASSRRKAIAARRAKGTIKIAVLVSSLEHGGTERVVTSLCNAWSARGDEVTLVPTYSGGGKPFFEVSDAVELIYLAEVVGVRARSALSYARRISALRRLIATRSPDVIVSFLPNVNLAAILSSAFLGIPLIICERSDPTSYPHENVIGTLCKWTYRFADMLTVQTDSVAAKVQGLYPGQKNVRAVPNPLPASVIAHQRTANSQRKVLLSLGRLSSEKQIDKLLDAFAEVAPLFGDWDLHIYGDGPVKPALAKQIHRIGLHGRAFLKGATKSPWEVMAAADIFVMTSKYEGFPNALLEAMGVGLPCIAFDCPSGPREISRNGTDALLVPLDSQSGLVSALTRLMEDENLRCALGKQARESVCSRFGLAEVVQRWDHLFREVGATN